MQNLLVRENRLDNYQKQLTQEVMLQIKPSENYMIKDVAKIIAMYLEDPLKEQLRADSVQMREDFLGLNKVIKEIKPQHYSVQSFYKKEIIPKFPLVIKKLKEFAAMNIDCDDLPPPMSSLLQCCETYSNKNWPSFQCDEEHPRVILAKKVEAQIKKCKGHLDKITVFVVADKIGDNSNAINVSISRSSFL